MTPEGGAISPASIRAQLLVHAAVSLSGEREVLAVYIVCPAHLSVSLTVAHE